MQLLLSLFFVVCLNTDHFVFVNKYFHIVHFSQSFDGKLRAFLGRAFDTEVFRTIKIT